MPSRVSSEIYMNVSAKSFSSSCVQRVCVTSVFFGRGFLPLAFDLPFQAGDDSNCEACVGECGCEFGGVSTKVVKNMASDLHIAVGKKALLGFETNGRDIEKNNRDIETNDPEIETYDRGVEMYGLMMVLRVMGSSN
uniref:Uncharacterized protein n=1 Tax=Tanacetum cinerariifolium TaxID=118510 RepID=A0A699H097_TANCI|nr:hypothetical protein [Tanacetum cinerariifolium]